MATATITDPKSEPVVVVDKQLASLVRQCSKTESENFRNVCRYVREHKIKLGVLKETYIGIYGEGQTARNEYNKVMKICAIDEVYNLFIKGKLTAAQAKDKATEYIVHWNLALKGDKTCEDGTVEPKVEGGNSEDSDKQFTKRLEKVARFGIEKLSMDEETFIGEAEERYKEAAAKVEKGKKKAKSSGDGAEEPTSDSEDEGAGYGEEDEGEELEEESGEEQKLVPRRTTVTSKRR